MKTLKEAREDRGVKQKAVASALGITRQTYAKYEEEPWKMPIFQGEAACAFLGYDKDEIFFGKLSSNT